MIYAFVDTNIFVRIATQGRPGCEMARFNDLRTLAEAGTVKLVVPEVVLLEVQKQFRTMSKDLASTCDQLGEATKKATDGLWNEIDSLKSDVLTHIVTLKEQRIGHCNKVSSELLTFLQSDKVVRIPLTPEILVSGKCRQISGRVVDAKNQKRCDQDVLIVESLVSYFKSRDEGPSLFLFCTENTKDFGLPLQRQELTRQFVLHPVLQESLPTARFSTELSGMLDVARGFEELPPPNNEEIEFAMDLRDTTDEDDPLYSHLHQLFMDEFHKEATKQFHTEILPSIPSDIQAVRKQLATEATELLAAGRRCHSWNDKSELKLPSWLEYVDEPMIPYTSLANLIRITEALRRYVAIHRKWDEESASMKE